MEGTTRRYLAGSVPRSLRASRLSYLPLDAVIGSWAIENPRDINQTFDVIMLPERDFRRAQHRLSEGQFGTPALQRGTLQVAYSIKDVRVVTVPATVGDPYRHALGRLAQLFDLHIDRTLYDDAPSVAASLRAPRALPLAPAAGLLEGPFVAALTARVARPVPATIEHNRQTRTARALRPRHRFVFMAADGALERLAVAEATDQAEVMTEATAMSRGGKAP